MAAKHAVLASASIQDKRQGSGKWNSFENCYKRSKAVIPNKICKNYMILLSEMSWNVHAPAPNQFRRVILNYRYSDTKTAARMGDQESLQTALAYQFRV